MELSYITIAIAVVISIAVFVIGSIKAYLSGKKAGIQEETIEKLEIEKDYSKRLFIEESRRKDLQREIGNLRLENQRYVQFLISIPDVVKDLASSLSFEETVSSIFRLTKYLVDPEIIELFIYDKKTDSLILVISFSSDRKQKTIKLGEGVVGLAAENRVMVSRASMQYLTEGVEKEGIDIAAPILSKEKLIGVIGLGKLKMMSGNERRFIAMIADLAGVSLQSCEYLETAKEEAITDALTGLYNRRYFFERAREASQKSITYNSPLSIFIFDIDHFKKYNDVNGHTEGDYLLKEISRFLKLNSRGKDVIARYGGEEFIILMPGTDKENAFTHAEKIRKGIEDYPFRYREKQPLGYVSVSGGVATFPFDGNSIDAVIKCADEALYGSKRSGRNKISRYEPFQFSV